MYQRETVELARLLSGLGTLDRENAAICGVSIRAIRHWRAGDRRSDSSQYRTSTPTCPRCGGRSLDSEAYAYLLGLYLGDGHITRGRRTHVLWLACSDAWPGLLALAKETTSFVMPSSKVFCASQRGVACTYVKSVSKHWPCLFPQHGPGRKHQRKIGLEPWQEEIVDRYPGDFARGLFIRMAAGLSTGSGARLRAATAGTSTRGICSSTGPPTYTGSAVKRSTGSGSPGGSRSRPRSRWHGGRRWPGWTSSSAPSTDDPGAHPGPATR